MTQRTLVGLVQVVVAAVIRTVVGVAVSPRGRLSTPGGGQLAAGPVVGLLAGPGPVAPAALEWLRIALFGVPFVLVTLAGNGWMRGVQDTARPLRYVLIGNGISALLCPVLVHGTGPVAGFGLPGSAVANVVAQVLAAGLFLRALVREVVTERALPGPSWPVMRAQLRVGRDLVLRAAAFQACFLFATSVAARTSAATAGAHQVVLQLWSFLAMVLDSLAIAAQSLVGAALGAGDERGARWTGHCSARETRRFCAPRPWLARWSGSCRWCGRPSCSAGG